MPRGNSLPGQWGGNISSSSWSIGDAAGDVSWYDYGYDLLSRLTCAKYGSGRAMQNDYTRRYSYDLNGNPKTRHAYDLSKLLFQEKTDRVWTWAVTDGNHAVGWTQNDYPDSYPEPVGPPVSPAPLSAGGSVTQEGVSIRPDLTLVHESYGYDAAGNRTDILNGSGDTLSVMRYNLLNLPAEYVSVDGDTVNYVYSADGEKLYVEENPSGGTVQGTEYAANYRIENGTVTMIHTDAGYYTRVLTPAGVTGPLYEHVWYLKDHLGNNRVLADGSGNAVARHDYDPFGEEISVASSFLPYPFPPGGTESPYKYGGKEWSATTSTYDFEARQFSPSFHRFTTMDPMAEKYYSISPYAYCADNPVNLVDPEGTCPGSRVFFYLLASNYLENHTNNNTLRTIGYSMQHPVIAYKVGPGKEMFRGLSAVAAKFSLNLMNAAGKGDNTEGSPINAFRHTLWQAMISSEFGESNAVRIGNAHENNSNIDLSQRVFESREEADTAADLLNNIIGRDIASDNPHLSNKDYADKVLVYYYTKGLWVSESNGTGFQIRQQQLSEDEYNSAFIKLFLLHENGLQN